MAAYHQLGRSADAFLMIAARNEFAHGTARRFLHRDAVEYGAHPQGMLLLIGQPQSHRHNHMMSYRYQR